MYEYASAIGQDSHRFVPEDQPDKPLVLGGFVVPGERGFDANSDGDVVLHALTNAISGITCRNILGGVADVLCLEQGIQDSRVYLREGLKDLRESGWEVTRVSFTIEAKRPKLLPLFPEIREIVGELLGIDSSVVGMTATSGEALSDVGRGLGMMVFCVVNVRRDV